MKSRQENNRNRVPSSEDRSHLLLLIVLAALVAAAVSAFVVDLNHNFLISSSDTSVFHNTLVNLVHGNGFRVTAYSGPNLLGQHSMFVLLLIAPLYALIPSVDMLFVLQVWVVYSAVFPLYLVARDILRNSLAAFLIGILALTSPLLFQMAAAPFHPESGILACVLWSYFFYRQNKALGFWITFGLAVSCAEQAAFIYVALGLALFFADDGLAWRPRYSKFALIGGAVWVILAMGLLIPIMSRPGQLNVMRYHYSQWGVASASDLVMAVAKQPVQAIEYLLSPARWFYVAELVGLPLVLAFVFPRSLVLLLPFPFYFLVSDHEFFLNFHAYYFQFAFFAGYLGLIGVLAWRNLFTGPGRAILAAAFLVNFLALVPVGHYFSGLAGGRDEALNATLRAEFATLPSDAAVYGPTRYCAYLSNRTNIVIGDLHEENLDLDARLADEYDFTDVHPEQIDYIVCDLLNDQCGWRMAAYNADTTKIRAANLNRYVQSGRWQVFWNQSSVVILRRTGK